MVDVPIHSDSILRHFHIWVEWLMGFIIIKFHNLMELNSFIAFGSDRKRLICIGISFAKRKKLQKFFWFYCSHNRVIHRRAETKKKIISFALQKFRWVSTRSRSFIAANISISNFKFIRFESKSEDEYIISFQQKTKRYFWYRPFVR